MFVYVPISVHTDRKTQILEHTEAHKCPDTHRHLDIQKHWEIQSLGTLVKCEGPRHWETRYINTEKKNHWDIQTLRHTNTDT